MAYRYIVNKNTDQHGLHEVHKENYCNHLPNPENRVYLGMFDNCQEALASARRTYPNDRFDGCAHCCPACHTRQRSLNMAKTNKGKKKVHVPAHTRSDGTKVREHYRSTPNQKLGLKQHFQSRVVGTWLFFSPSTNHVSQHKIWFQRLLQLLQAYFQSTP